MRQRAALHGTLGLLVLLAAWQISVPLVGLESWYYPSPLDVVGAFFDLMRKGILPVDIADSLRRYGAGVAIGTVLGVAMGLLIGLNRQWTGYSGRSSTSCSPS